MAEPRLYNSLVAEAACNAGRHVIYGFKLKPFSLRHSLQLSQLGNPLWAGTGTAEPEDLMAAAQICASEIPVLEFVAPEYTDPCAELDKWVAYMETCAAKPMTKDRVRNDKLGSEYGTPIEIAAVTYMMRVLGIPEARAWDMPYGMAWWYIESACEQETGESMILTEEEAADLDAMNAPEERAKREALNENAAWIIANIDDPQIRQELLNKATRGELAEGWKEAYNG